MSGECGTTEMMLLPQFIKYHSSLSSYAPLLQSRSPMPKQPTKPRSTEDILREMENVSKGIGRDSEEDDLSGRPTARHGGALKSLLNFFVTVVPEEQASDTNHSSDHSPAA